MTVVDDDAVGLVFSRTALSVTEGATALYTVRLASRPTATVTVTATSGDTGAVSVSVWSSLTFTTTNWDLPRTITVGGVPDADAADESVLVTHTASGGDYGAVSETVTVAVVDAGTAAPGLVFSRTALSVTEGATASYTLRLATQPTGAVTVEVTSSDSGAVSVPARFTFTTGNWDQARMVTVGGVSDGDGDDESVTVTHTASGGGYGGVSATVTVTVVDPDVVARGLVFSRTALSVDEGATASYTLRLATRPGGAVTVVVTSSDSGAVSVPARFTFTTGNWDQARPVTVGGVSDGDGDDESVTVTHTASGGGYGGVSATVTVDVVDAGVPAGLVFSRTALSVDEGATASYTLRLATRPNGAVTVEVTSSDSGAVSVPARFTFTTGNWDQARPVTVGGVSDGDGDDESVTVTHTASGGGYGGVSATVTVDCRRCWRAGGPGVLAYCVERRRGRDGVVHAAFGDPAGRCGDRGGDVERQWRGVGAGAVHVHDGELGPGPPGHGWWRVRRRRRRRVGDDAHGVGWRLWGRSATVTTVVDPDVVARGLVFSRTALSVDEGATASYTLRLATRPGGAVTVVVTSSDSGAVSVPARFTFTTGNWDQARPVTVGGVSDGDGDDESVTVTHTASGGGYGGVSATVTVDVVDAGVPAGLGFAYCVERRRGRDGVVHAAFGDPAGRCGDRGGDVERQWRGVGAGAVHVHDGELGPGPPGHGWWRV